MRLDPYKTFLVHMALSFIIMYGVMFLNVDTTDHIYLSTTRTYMTLLMITPMAVLMLVLMGHMYKNRQKNMVILLFAVLTFGGALYGLRTQTPIGDIQYMKAMIPHHSSAIMTSENAYLEDPRVQQLAKEIIEAQKREIALMKELLEEGK